MKKIYKIAITALTTAMLSISAIAAPYDGHREHRFNSKQPSANFKHQNPHWKNQQPRAQYRGAPTPQHFRGHPSKPSHQWQVQHKLPSTYKNSSYRISSYQRHQLSKPAYNQQWYKVNGYYLLTDKKTDRILRVVRG